MWRSGVMCRRRCVRLQSAFVRKPDWNAGLLCGYERLLEFGRKHLPDRFYLEGGQRKSLRGIIVREMVSNTLIHREYTSSYQAKFVIERSRMCVENANRAAQEACLTPDNAEPNPKNPIIASFFSRHRLRGPAGLWSAEPLQVQQGLFRR